MYLFLKKKWNTNQKHPSYKSCSQDLKIGYDEKDVKSKVAGQGLCRNTFDYIDNDDPGHNVYS